MKSLLKFSFLLPSFVSVSRRVPAILLGATLGACTHGGADGVIGEDEALATTGSQQGAASAEVYPTCTAGAPDFGKLSLALEIHVENADLDAAEETDYILEIAEQAATAGVTLSFGLGVDILREYAGGVTISTADHGDFTLTSLVAALQGTYCHAVTLHADLPENATYGMAKTYLTPLVTALNDAGASGSVASGICNETSAQGGWLRAAVESGVRTVSGVVEYCQASLDPATNPDDYIAPMDCTPSRCHDAAPADEPVQRASGWFARQVLEWITPAVPASPAQLRRSVFIIGSFGEANAPCLAEKAAGLDVGAECGDGFPSNDHVADDDYSTSEEGVADADVLLLDVADVVDHYRSGTGDAYHTAFSTNEVVTADWLQGFFGRLGEGMQDDTTALGTALIAAAQFSTLPAVGQYNRTH